MKGLVRPRETLPIPVAAAIILLAVAVPVSAYVQHGIRVWQLGTSPAAALTEPWFRTVWIGRSAGALLLALVLIYRWRPSTVAATTMAVWLAGPPLTLLLGAIDLLAASAGRASWSPSLWRDLAVSAALPSAVSALLLIPRSVRSEIAAK